MKLKLVAIVAILALGLSSCSDEVKKVDLKTQKDKVSYSIGLDIGKNLKRQYVEIDSKAFMQGLKDAMTKDSLYLLSDAEINEVMQQFQKDLSQTMERKMKESADKNKKEGDEFLAKNAKRNGVKKTASGLQYEVLRSGNGPTPNDTSTVTVNYRGTLVNGKEFDNSYKRGQPATFPVKGVIRGWTEALQLMKAGDKWKIYIPSDLAYGPNGAGEVIPPNATLIFEVELLDVK